MKNLLALGILLLLAGCQENVQPETIEQTEVETVRNDRVIDHNGEIENLELLHQFLKDTEDNKQSSLELTRYTIEGHLFTGELNIGKANITSKSITAKIILEVKILKITNVVS